MEVTASEACQLQIFDAVGRLVRSVGIIEGKQTIDLQGLESGIHVYQLQQRDLLKVGEKGRILVVK